MVRTNQTSKRSFNQLFCILMIIIVLIGSVLAITYEQTVRVTVVLPNDTHIYSPLNGSIYDTRRILFNFTAGAFLDSIKYSDDGIKFKTLCKDCNEYGFSRKRTKLFKEGFNDLVIRGLVEEFEFDVNVQFFVDSKEPKIKRTIPRRRFTNGEFEVEFLEENPEKLVLKYGNDYVGYRDEGIVIDDCYDYNSKKCEVSVNLSDYDGQKITYWFELEDITGKSDKSSLRKVKVDFTKPVISYFNYSIDRRKVNFFLVVIEDNFDEVVYIDYNENKPRGKKLCSRLKDGVCDKRKRFSKGEHNVTIEVLDDAGNKEMIENLVFEVL